MKMYSVVIPITGILEVTVEAEDEEAAIEKALEADVSNDNILEWETCRKIVTGNVFHGHTNEAHAEEM